MLVAPGVAEDLDAVAVLGEAVDERHHAGGAGEDGAPLLEGEVGGDDRRGALVTAADEVIEDLGGAAAAGQIAELVEEQKVRRGAAAEAALGRTLDRGGRRTCSCSRLDACCASRHPRRGLRLQPGPLLFFGVLGRPIYGEILAASTFLPTDPTVNSRRLWAAVNTAQAERPRAVHVAIHAPSTDQAVISEKL